MGVAVDCPDVGKHAQLPTKKTPKRVRCSPSAATPVHKGTHHRPCSVATLWVIGEHAEHRSNAEQEGLHAGHDERSQGSRE